MYGFMYVRMCVFLYDVMIVCMHVCTYACMYVSMYACMYMHGRCSKRTLCRVELGAFASIVVCALLAFSAIFHC